MGEEDVRMGLGGEEGGRLQLGCKVINKQISEKKQNEEVEINISGGIDSCKNLLHYLDTWS